jgi:hypothetical protein
MLLVNHQSSTSTQQQQQQQRTPCAATEQQSGDVMQRWKGLQETTGSAVGCKLKPSSQLVCRHPHSEML